VLNLKKKEDFFAFARERYKIFLKKQTEPWPWTTDPVLQEFRFCNVFREDDTTTVWFRENLREPLKSQLGVVFATVAFRWFNRIETGAVLKPLLLDWQHWSEARAEAALTRHKQQNNCPLFTGAYVIKSPDGKSKLKGILDCITYFHAHFPEELGGKQESLEDTHRRLMGFPYLGRFMAYEVVTDLRHTAYLEHAEDTNSWASAGPGCARGLGWVYADKPDVWNYNSRPQQTAMLGVMRELLNMSREQHHWPRHWPQWEMREVEHVLCEYDKYRRAQAGERLKRRYIVKG